MAEIVLTPLENLESETSACEAINANFEAVKTAIEAALSRLGQTSNQMETSLDMNDNNLTNLAPPQSGTDAARWIDVYAGVTLIDYAVPNLAGNVGKFLSTNDGLTLTWVSGAAGSLLAVNNLSDVQNVIAARSNLGLGTAAQANTGVSGSNVPILNVSNTWSAVQNFSAAVALTGGATLGGTADYKLTAVSTTLTPESIGFRGAPQKIPPNGVYTFVLDDAGRGLTKTEATARAWTIPPDVDVAFPVHTIIPVDNQGTGDITLTRGAGVNLRVNGSATNTDVTVPQNFVKSLYKEAANRWVVL